MKIFVATPISCFENEEQMLEYKESLIPFLCLLRKKHIVNAEIEKIDNNDYGEPAYSVRHDFGLITECDVFVIHYPNKIATSALIELGYAVAFCKKIVIVVENIETLPFLGQGLDSVYNNVSIVKHKNLDLNCAQLIIKLLETQC